MYAGSVIRSFSIFATRGGGSILWDLSDRGPARSLIFYNREIREGVP
jgi:hypothetical protein